MTNDGRKYVAERQGIFLSSKPTVKGGEGGLHFAVINDDDDNFPIGRTKTETNKI